MIEQKSSKSCVGFLDVVTIPVHREKSHYNQQLPHSPICIVLPHPINPTFLRTPVRIRGTMDISPYSTSSNLAMVRQQRKTLLAAAAHDSSVSALGSALRIYTGSLSLSLVLSLSSPPKMCFARLSLWSPSARVIDSIPRENLGKVPDDALRCCCCCRTLSLRGISVFMLTRAVHTRALSRQYVDVYIYVPGGVYRAALNHAAAGAKAA